MSRAGWCLLPAGSPAARGLLETYAPELVDAVRHGGIANTGDGLVMATALGAGHADLGYVSGSFGGAIRNYPDVVRDENEIPPLLFAFKCRGDYCQQEWASLRQRGAELQGVERDLYDPAGWNRLPDL